MTSHRPVDSVWSTSHLKQRRPRLSGGVVPAIVQPSVLLPLRIGLHPIELTGLILHDDMPGEKVSRARAGKGYEDLKRGASTGALDNRDAPRYPGPGTQEWRSPARGVEGSARPPVPILTRWGPASTAVVDVPHTGLPSGFGSALVNDPSHGHRRIESSAPNRFLSRRREARASSYRRTAAALDRLVDHHIGMNTEAARFTWNIDVDLATYYSINSWQ